MAIAKDGAGKPGAVSGPVRAVNRANQPREFRVRGRWIRWEPSGTPGDSAIVTAEEAASADFAAVARYFSVTRG